MHLKTFQKRSIKQSTPQFGLKPPRPFAQPNPPVQQSGVPTLDAVERAERYGHTLARIAVRAGGSAPERTRRNVTGLPERLKAGIERLSGLSLDDVRVRYNSPAPARYRARAHTQGTEIHLGAGQERHLAHEAWHVVQQKQGRVRPTVRMEGGVAVNNDEGLEREADVMGERALAARGADGEGKQPRMNVPTPAQGASTVQRYPDKEMEGFRQRRINERRQELSRLNTGFVMNGGVQPGPYVRGALGLMRSRFDLSGVADEDRDSVEHAISGGTNSRSQNHLVTGVGTELFGRMLRNVGPLSREIEARRERNIPRILANMSPPHNSSIPLHSLAPDPNTVEGAENAVLRVGVNKAKGPHYDPANNSVSLMIPEQMDQTAHELQHARDHLLGELDLNNPNHRLASELNAFTRQRSVSLETTRAPPTNFLGRTPSEMAQSYEGKRAYPGTLESSLAEGQTWRAQRGVPASPLDEARRRREARRSRREGGREEKEE